MYKLGIILQKNRIMNIDECLKIVSLIHAHSVEHSRQQYQDNFQGYELKNCLYSFGHRTKRQLKFREKNANFKKK